MHHLSGFSSSNMGSPVRAISGPAPRRGLPTWFATALCAAAPFFCIAALPAAEPIATQLSALKYETTLASDGSTREALVPFTTIVPGESIRYAVDFTNTGTAPAANLVVELPLPGEMTLVAGSAEHEDTAVAYSIDGGATFGTLAVLTVRDADGRSRAAQWSDVTTVRWTVLTALAPGAGGTVACRVVLK
jgi:uncharacterized repeat protein (TIGR01451 family)